MTTSRETSRGPGARARAADYVVSKDGTAIAFERTGSGPAVILVTGALDDGTENEPLAREMSRTFTVYNYARRGRAASGDTLPYAVEREIEDLAALIAHAGGHAHLYGVSSGGALVLEAAIAGVRADKLATYEVPYDTSEGAEARHRAYATELERLLGAGRRTDALVHFMRLAGSSDEEIGSARRSSLWAGLEALAPTLAYDAAVLRDGRPDPGRLATVRQATLVATGATHDFFERGSDAIAASVPRAERLLLRGQPHVADPKILAPALARFFTTPEPEN